MVTACLPCHLRWGPHVAAEATLGSLAGSQTAAAAPRGTCLPGYPIASKKGSTTALRQILPAWLGPDPELFIQDQHRVTSSPCMWVCPSCTHGQQWLRKGSEDWGGILGFPCQACHRLCLEHRGCGPGAAGAPRRMAGFLVGARPQAPLPPSRGGSQDLSICCDGNTRVLCIC